MDEDDDGPLGDRIARRAVDVELEGHEDALLVDRGAVGDAAGLDHLGEDRVAVPQRRVAGGHDELLAATRGQREDGETNEYGAADHGAPRQRLTSTDLVGAKGLEPLASAV